MPEGARSKIGAGGAVHSRCETPPPPRPHDDDGDPAPRRRSRLRPLARRPPASTARRCARARSLVRLALARRPDPPHPRLSLNDSSRLLRSTRLLAWVARNATEKGVTCTTQSRQIPSTTSQCERYGCVGEITIPAEEGGVRGGTRGRETPTRTRAHATRVVSSRPVGRGYAAFRGGQQQQQAAAAAEKKNEQTASSSGPGAKRRPQPAPLTE